MSALACYHQLANELAEKLTLRESPVVGKQQRLSRY
jgi:hypothetical protein